ncbi:PNGase F N-terminal domain-containing protein [uncultured Bacteroides sp.]|uniref:PNGase F N-terminal domain-containing protein n=1 Tax=uncultured Bacteroides sp. TaxID=162156 RepID=UPI00280B5F5C|nr:PNGase F N-terminal domain-containing protein [uncultured Bacteroides sp.]
MKIVSMFVSLFVAMNIYAAGHKELPAKGDLNLAVFNKENIHFAPDMYPNYAEADTNGVIHLVNGRIILKKIQIPDYQRDVTVSVKVTLASNGDRWDKSGSCFVIPKHSAINLLSIAQGKKKFPEIDSLKLENMVGIVPGKDYLPTIELMRFMTPFGVGHFSENDDSLSSKRRPVYIPKWEKCVQWEQDITDLYSALKGEVYVGIFIDTWTKEGYVASMDLKIKETPVTCEKLVRRHVEPLMNTVYYIGQTYPDIFARKSVSTDFVLPENAKNVRLKYIVTGHGGHEGGDEFVQKRNILSVDGKEVYSFIPWRDDCASFRRFNPATGVWLIKRLAAYISEEGYKTKEVEEPLASSDLSRSNWCPGSDVTPEEISLKDLKAGKHTFTVSIPEAQPASGNELNHWLISAYLVWEE